MKYRSYNIFLNFSITQNLLWTYDEVLMLINSNEAWKISKIKELINHAILQKKKKNYKLFLNQQYAYIVVIISEFILINLR